MRILAIDTTAETCSIALWNNGAIHVKSKKCHREHNKYILTIVQSVLAHGDVTLAELDALAFSRGPGNFNGVRIGVGVAQGLAFGAVIPMISVSTLLTIAQGIWYKTGAKRILVTMHARIGEIYWAAYIRDQYGVWHGETSETLIKEEAIDDCLQQLSGEWVAVSIGLKTINWLNFTDKFNIIPQDGNMLLSMAECMLPIAYQLFLAGKTISAGEAEPFYFKNEFI